MSGHSRAGHSPSIVLVNWVALSLTSVAYRHVMTVTVGHGRDAAATARILRGLPEWFGIESAIEGYLRDTDNEALDSYLAIDGGIVVGIALVSWPLPSSPELHLLAVDAGHRGQGIGRLLVGSVAENVRHRGARLLSVHTVGPSFRDDAYAQTRRFYQAVGFIPVKEFENIDWDGPTLVLVQPL